MVNIYKRIQKIPQLVRFFFIGGFFALADLIILYIMTDVFGWFYLVSAVFGFIIVTSTAFFVHKHITFQCKREDRIRQYIFFFVVNIMGLALYSGILLVGVEVFGWFYLAVAIAAKFIVFIWNYYANKHITFRIIHV